MSDPSGEIYIDGNDDSSRRVVPKASAGDTPSETHRGLEPG